MKKFVIFFACVFIFPVVALAQCPVDSVFTLYAQSSFGNHFAYIDQLSVDNTVITTNTNVNTWPSYQQFNSPVIQLEQYGNHDFEIMGLSDGAYSVGVWIDLDRDLSYSSNEYLGYAHSNFANGTIHVYVSLPMDAFSDTVDLRVVKIYDPFNSGFNGGNCCTFGTDAGEVEDYKAFINCNFSIPWVSFDPNPQMCFETNEFLFAATSYGQLYWYNDMNGTPIDSGNGFTYQPVGLDTNFYFNNVIGGCVSQWYGVQVNLMPAPVMQINSADTVYSCSAVTFDAGAGFYSYQWSTGDQTQTTTISNGYGGQLSVTVTGGNGCAATDHVWTAIAPNPPSSYAHYLIGQNFCVDQTGYLVYDSLISPGTINWFETSTGNPIGSGSYLPYVFPDSGYYYFTGIINSMCGLDTAYLSVYIEGNATVDSIYSPTSVLDSTGTAIFCYTSGAVEIIAGGLSGIVDYWELIDFTSNFNFNWPVNNDTISLSSSLMTQGHLYGFILHYLNAQGCMGASDTLFGRPGNFININFADTTYFCNFPAMFGPSVNYSVFDVLWNTNDTTGTILVSSPGFFTITVSDVTTGCFGSSSTYIANGITPFDFFQPVTPMCNGQVEFDGNNLNNPMWTEFDNGFNYVNSDGNQLYVTNNDQDYVVVQCMNDYGCMQADTTLISLSASFNFSLGPDVVTPNSSYTINGPAGMSFYLWTPGGFTTQNITVTAPGNYTLNVTNPGGCMDSDVINIGFLTTGITANENENDFSMYPNPAGDHLTVEAEKINTVNIYDAEGRIVLSENAIDKTQIDLNTSSLNNGYYIVEIIADGNRSRKKLIIGR
jgi:hypothetical protein